MDVEASDEEIVRRDDVIRKVKYYKRDFWKQENLKYCRAHYRMQKCARLVNRLAGSRECSLLDVGCGPATLSSLLSPRIEYFGIDIAIRHPAPNLKEFDFLEAPIGFADRQFDLIVAQGVFEYIGEHQEQKFAEIAELLCDDGIFIASYVNFDHRAKDIYWPYSNVRSFNDFRRSLARHFKLRRHIPTSHNWKHNEPGNRFVSAANMRIDISLPIISRLLAVEYFFICSRLNQHHALELRAPELRAPRGQSFVILDWRLHGEVAWCSFRQAAEWPQRALRQQCGVVWSLVLAKAQHRCIRTQCPDLSYMSLCLLNSPIPGERRIGYGTAAAPPPTCPASLSSECRAVHYERRRWRS